mgnify:CR=1 FL=1
MKNIPNPYIKNGVTSSDLVRIQADVSYEDRNFLRSICPEQGVYNFIVANFIIKLCHELRQRNITDYARESDFKSAITNLRLDLGGTATGGLSNGTSSGLVRTPDAPDERERTQGQGDGDSAAKDVQPDVQSESGGETQVDGPAKRVRRSTAKNKKGS